MRERTSRGLLLIVDVDRRKRESLATHLRGAGFDVATAGTRTDVARLLQDHAFDIVVIDYGKSFDGRRGLIKYLRRCCPSLRAILLNDLGSDQAAFSLLTLEIQRQVDRWVSMASEYSELEDFVRM